MRRRSTSAVRLVAPIAAALALALAVGVPPAVASAMPPVESRNECGVLEARTAEAAASLATSCGERVEVLDERTPWETSYVTEAGKSVLEISVYPTRTDVNGHWEAIDTTIEESSRAGAALDIAAPVLDMQLNGGDTSTSQPLGVIQANGQSFKVWFPLALPEPVVDEDRVTYGLAVGVRVVTYVSPAGTGFTPVVELDDRNAAEWFHDALTESAASSTSSPRGGNGDGPSSSYEDITRGSSTRNIETDVAAEDFMATLEANGWTRTVVGNGRVNLFTKDGATYSVRNFARTWNGWSVNFRPAGAVDDALKLRLPGAGE